MQGKQQLNREEGMQQMQLSTTKEIMQAKQHRTKKKSMK